MKSTVWSFKRAHKEQLQKQSEKMKPNQLLESHPNPEGGLQYF